MSKIYKLEEIKETNIYMHNSVAVKAIFSDNTVDLAEELLIVANACTIPFELILSASKLIRAFSWNNAPQGYDYWRHLSEAIEFYNYAQGKENNNG